MNAIINNQMIIIGKSKYLMENLDSSSIEKYFEENIDAFSSNCPIVNEVFIKYAHLLKALKELFLKYDITNITIASDPDRTLLACAQDALDNKHISIIKKVSLHIRQSLTILGTFLYLAIEILRGKKIEYDINSYSGFFVSRAKADIKMINAICDKNVCGMYDKYGTKGSFYRFFSIKDRIKLLIHSYSRAGKELAHYCQYVSDVYGIHCGYDTRRFYSIRILQTVLYEACVDRIAEKFNKKTYYTADNLDRFALIQERIAEKHGLELVCIPHGIEYGFILPHCFVGDMFYATSEYASRYLCKKYQSNKFLFDSDIVRLMFHVPHEIKEKKKFVFFTESRESYINLKILKRIIPIFKNKNEVLFIKYHPADNPKKYESIINEVEIISDFSKAISNSVCIARKSTVLIEALYNDSFSIAILENRKDKEIFSTIPSLSEKDILKVESLDMLCKGIEKLIDIQQNGAM